MNIFKCQTDLNEPIKYLLLSKELLVLCFTFQMVGQVSNFTVFHYDNQLLECKITLLIADDIRMI